MPWPRPGAKRGQVWALGGVRGETYCSIMDQVRMGGEKDVDDGIVGDTCAR